ncbi:fasciclin domain-containing protein [Chitinophaga vietnamensis]|uniref:fasciclin domain-containing protein n=1 Tax=Chitinophaga vietnamensis TaxID=2593957 RepID=UPI001177BC83|nr:fasciclin domain-containing protein [Chitinophaga vietnamensis]
MKLIHRLHTCCLPLLLVLLALAAGCNKTDLQVSNEHSAGLRNMGDFIRNNYDLSLLAAGLQKIGMLDSLNSTELHTIWAPDNNAFNAIGVKRPSDFNTMNTDSLRYALKNLIMPQRIYVSDIPTQMDNKYTGLAGGPLLISINNIGSNNADAFRATVNGCPVYDAPRRNIALQNGVLHLLQAVPKYFPETAQDFLAADSTLSIFTALMKKTGQWDALKQTGPYTIYAPVNDAFRQYGLTADSIARLDVSRYKALAFNIYTLELKPYHLFQSDPGMMQVTDINIYLTGGYYMQASYGISIWAPGGRYAYHSPSGIGYVRKDDMTNNSVIFHLDNIMLYPDSLLIK